MDRFIMRELRTNQPVDIFRRSLQRNYVDKLLRLAEPSSTSRSYNDIVPETLAQLKSLRDRLPRAIRKTDDVPTRNHFQYILDQLNDALPAD
jgi:hypothetical protein